MEKQKKAASDHRSGRLTPCSAGPRAVPRRRIGGRSTARTTQFQLRRRVNVVWIAAEIASASPEITGFSPLDDGTIAELIGAGVTRAGSSE